MEKNKDQFSRNRTADEGRNHDPGLRDESAAQPGVSTASSSDTDEANQHLTRTTVDHERMETYEDQKADPDFDNV